MVDFTQQTVICDVMIQGKPLPFANFPLGLFDRTNPKRTTVDQEWMDEFFRNTNPVWGPTFAKLAAAAVGSFFSLPAEQERQVYEKFLAQVGRPHGNIVEVDDVSKLYGGGILGADGQSGDGK